ncbi:MAG TPA: xyloglucanase, partial [Polyangiaceae bacterium]
TKGDEIYRTNDGGKTWKALGTKAVRDDAGAHYLYWDRDKPSSSGWMGDIDIDPFNPGRAMYVTGQGLWATDDATAADSDKPTHWVFRDKNLEETVVAGLCSPPSGAPLLSVVADLGGFRHDDLDKPSPKGMFQTPIFGSGTGIDFAAKKPEVVARVGWAGGAGKHGAVSMDGGSTWKPFDTEPPGNGAGSVAVSADGETLVWSPKGGGAAFSRDRGASWVRADGLPEPAKIPDWAPVNLRPAADRVNPQKMYAYDSLKGIAYASTDGGAHFASTQSTMPSLPDYNLGSGSAQATPEIEGDVWLTTGKELYHSTDSGKTYSSLSNVDESVAVGFGKPASGNYPAVYLIGKVGGTAGFFRSDDVGATWSRINDDEHQYGFTGVIIGDPRTYGRVYVGTGGRGILYGDPTK